MEHDLRSLERQWFGLDDDVDDRDHEHDTQRSVVVARDDGDDVCEYCPCGATRRTRANEREPWRRLI
jgi:hypothetical protein